MTTEQHDQLGARQSRWSFFQTVEARATAMAAVATREHPIADVSRGHEHYTAMLPSDRFGRMFPQLPPFTTAGPAVEEALLDIGKAGGILVAMDYLSKGPELLVTDATLSEHIGSRLNNHPINHHMW